MKKINISVIVGICIGVLFLVGVILYNPSNGNRPTSPQDTSSVPAASAQGDGMPQTASPYGNSAPAPQNAILQISTKDYKNPSTIYSTLALSVPQNAFSSPTEVKVSAIPPTACGNLSGAYLPFPQGQQLLVPATVSITYTNAAVSLHKECYSDFIEVNLTLAYYDNSLNKYVALQSTFDPSTRTVSGSISQFYSGGIMIVPTSLIH